MIAQEYLDYMNESYRQEYAYIQKKDIAVDHDKLRMFFEHIRRQYQVAILIKHGQPPPFSQIPALPWNIHIRTSSYFQTGA